MVPLLVPEHQHHQRVVDAMTALVKRGYQMIVAAHTLLETYSVLTRMPPPQRVSPRDAQRGIQDTFLDHAEVVSLAPGEYSRLLGELALRGISEGQVYDAAIVACARLGGADTILTFNERHFRRFEGDGLIIEVP